jgi:flagellar basal body P-ring formation protein FlgA
MIRALPLILLLMTPAAAHCETAAQLIEEEARGAFSLALPDAARIQVTFQGDMPGDAVLISAFRMNPTTGQFIADAVLADGTEARLSGLASPLVPVPVPVRAIPAGTVLQEADLRIEEIHVARVGALTALEPGAMIGMETRQALSPGRPVMRQSLAEPVVIRRGEVVALRYKRGALSLNVSARAMGDAASGALVRVVNLSSNALVNAVVTAPGVVTTVGP